jgi:flagellar motor switch protein FliG
MQTKIINRKDAAAELPALAGPQKAAIIIQMVLSEGGSLPLSSLSQRSQTRLMQDFVELGRVDRATLGIVVADLERDLASMGLSFPRSVSDALATLEAHLNPDLVSELRGELGLTSTPSPWGKITTLPNDTLLRLIPDEDPTIAAIILSKLDAEKASEVLDAMPPELAAQVSLAMQNTATIRPDMLARIGTMLLDGIPVEPPKAFTEAPALRLANLLNAASPDRRDAVLAALSDSDAAFAEEVRSSIFTFADITTRITATDISKVTRDVAQEDLVQALCYAAGPEPEAAEFVLSNLSQRMADALREEIAELGSVDKKPGEAAMGKLTSAIRRLVDAGEISLIKPVKDGEEEG